MYVIMWGWRTVTLSERKPSKKKQWYSDTAEKDADLWQRIFILA